MALTWLKLRERLLQSFIIAIPLIHGSKPDRIMQEDYFKYLGMCLVSFFCGSAWIAAFMTLNVMLFIHHGEQVGLSQILNIFIGICLFMAAKSFFTVNKISSIRKPLLILCFINILWMVLQKFGVDPLFASQDATGVVDSGSNVQTIGVMGVKFASGLLMVLGAIFLYPNVLATLLILVPIALCASSSVGMAYASFIIFFAWFRLKRIFFYGLLVLCFIGCLAFLYKDYKDDPKQFSSRFPVWHSCVKYALQYPLGYGPDSYRKIHKHKDFLFGGDGEYNHAIMRPKGDVMDFTYYVIGNNDSRAKKLAFEALQNGKTRGKELNEWDNPHNGFLNILFQYGLLGLIIMIGFLRELVLRFKQSVKDHELLVISSCLIAFFAASMTNFPIELARLGYLFPIFLGAFYAKTRVA